MQEASEVSLEENGVPRPAAEIRTEREQRLRKVLAEYPNDFFVQERLTMARRGPVASDELVAEARSRAAERPQDPEAQYLLAVALTGKSTPEALSILAELARAHPAFPWTYRSLAEIHQAPAFQDREKTKQNSELFFDRCPDAPETARLALNLDRSDELMAYTKRLRAGLAGRTDPESVHSYFVLWRLEFKLTPLPEQEPLREQVKKDLAFLESLDNTKHRNLTYLLSEGYKLTGDKQALERAMNSRKDPGSRMQAYFEAQNKWIQANPYPTVDDAGKRDEHTRKHLAFLDEWSGRLPDETMILSERLRLLDQLKDTPDSTILSGGEKALAVARTGKNQMFPISTIPTTVAQIWAKRGLELDRIPDLLLEADSLWSKRDQQTQEFGRSDLYADPGQEVMEQNSRWYRDSSSWDTLALVYTKLKRNDEARKVLAQWETALGERKKKAAEIKQRRDKDPAPAAPQPQVARTGTIGGTSTGLAQRTRMMEDQIVDTTRFDEARYLRALAALAVAESRPQDALAMYQAALRAHASGRFSSPDVHKTEDGKKAAELWKETGGTAEGWQWWLEGLKPLNRASKPEGERAKWTAATRALPELKLTSREGQTWTVANFKGKTTLLNVWASWCGPCRTELPHLQKLHDQIKDREDLQVVTLNVDENTGLVEPYLKENQFTFPVLFAKQFIDDFTGPLGIPTNWIADPSAKVRLEAIGFGGDGSEWIRSTLAELEKMRQAPPL